ncbi:unnamed protein product, partial [Brassica oleracea var. botrytis]
MGSWYWSNEIMGEDKEYLDDYGEWHRRSSPDTGVMDEGNRRNLRKHRILGNWGQISMVNQILIINKTKSQISEGIDSDFGVSIWIFLFIKEIGIYSFPCDLFGAWRIWFGSVFGNENRSILGIKCEGINFIRYDLYEGICWRDYLVKGLRYKRSFVLLGCYINFYTLARWQPKKSQLFPSEIPFWVRLIGVPLEFRTVPTFESIGNAIGKTVAVDLDRTRVPVVIDAFKE